MLTTTTPRAARDQEIRPCECGTPVMGQDARPCINCRGGHVPSPHTRQGRFLTYAITFGLDQFTISQLEDADAAAMRAVTVLPGKPHTPDTGRLDEILRTIRRRIARRIEAKRAQLADLQKLIDQCDQESQHAANDSQAPELSDQERAIQLLRAALTLIMQPPGSQDGGKGARLIAPTPNRPPGTNAIDPHAPAGRRF